MGPADPVAGLGLAQSHVETLTCVVLVSGNSVILSRFRGFCEDHRKNLALIDLSLLSIVLLVLNGVIQSAVEG